jgi:hypothetical protein
VPCREVILSLSGYQGHIISVNQSGSGCRCQAIRVRLSVPDYQVVRLSGLNYQFQTIVRLFTIRLLVPSCQDQLSRSNRLLFILTDMDWYRCLSQTGSGLDALPQASVS